MPRRPSCLPSRQDSKAVRANVVGAVCSGVTRAEELLDTIGRFSTVCLLQHWFTLFHLLNHHHHFCCFFQSKV
ncbi:hypothetical protein L6452_29527 [Arctium lappa]|uniref:Uncharacterized protein n=1 Tax=Arctium lappa TaxID=4217 RepID=A0ACB8ZG31_ARCLA|nr:hypothetical protein L6452_29527 [Arctium lappa]